MGPPLPLDNGCMTPLVPRPRVCFARRVRQFPICSFFLGTIPHMILDLPSRTWVGQLLPSLAILAYRRGIIGPLSCVTKGTPVSLMLTNLDKFHHKKETMGQLTLEHMSCEWRSPPCHQRKRILLVERYPQVM